MRAMPSFTEAGLIALAAAARAASRGDPFANPVLSVALALHRAGFLSFVTRGGPYPPDPSSVATFEPEPLTTANVASQRLWLGLKYNPGSGGAGDPVLRSMRPISTPAHAK